MRQLDANIACEIKWSDSSGGCHQHCDVSNSDRHISASEYRLFRSKIFRICKLKINSWWKFFWRLLVEIKTIKE